MELSQFLNRPLTVGGKIAGGRLFLAPMASLGHIAFRELLEGFGGYGLMFTEMCSSKAVPNENRHNSTVFKWRDEELETLVCQLFGSEPEVMAEAARRVEDEGFFGVDINFGCSVSGICRKNAGAALLKDPDLAVSIVAAVRKAVSIPVFVKYRTGWEDDPEYPAILGARFQDAGADALTFHPRVAPDRRSRPPKWAYIARVKKAVNIPVFGNGNVFDAADCSRMIKETGCDGVSLGRIAIAKPWIFPELTLGKAPAADVLRQTALAMADLLEKHYEAPFSVKLFKKFAIYYAGNFTFGHQIYSKICGGEGMDDIRENIHRIFETPPLTAARPNMNMFTR